MTNLKLFISHHHKDAGALSKLKARLKTYYIDAFVAHEDIKLGENDLETIKKELQECDVFLLIGNQLSKKSVFVNQEIGYAVALKKTIISTIKEGVKTWGFIARQQAIEFKNLEDTFIDTLLQSIGSQLKANHYLSKKQKALSLLGIDNFLKNVSGADETWTLKIDTGWNNYKFETSCNLHDGQKIIASLQIAHAKFPDSPDPTRNLPTKDNKIDDFLPASFKFLGKDFFSRIDFQADDLSEERKKSIRCLFNDIEHDPEIKELYKNKSVTEVSLFRDEPEKYEEFLNSTDQIAQTNDK